MADGADEPVYACVEAGGRFEVRAESGKCVVVCGDRHNAEHYTALLNEAWRSGFRQGYRQGSREASREGNRHGPGKAGRG